MSWVSLVSVRWIWGGGWAGGSQARLAEFGTALSCQSPPPLFILNLPRFSSFTQADQSSSSCLQLLPIGLQRTSLGLASTVPSSCPPPPSHVYGVCLRICRSAALELGSVHGSHRSRHSSASSRVVGLGFSFFLFCFSSFHWRISNGLTSSSHQQFNKNCEIGP